jgi:hypothetical protein
MSATIYGQQSRVPPPLQNPYHIWAVFNEYVAEIMDKHTKLFNH